MIAELVWLGHDPHQLSMRHALLYVEHIEAIYDHRADLIAAGIARAFD